MIAHNKTLAAQLCNEFREFFPDNAVEYFVSYYDYYQPEAYVPRAGPLHREGLLDQRRDRPAAPRGDRVAVRPPRRDHRRLGLLHLRDRLAAALPASRCSSSRSATGSTATRSSASWSGCSTSATTRRSAAAPSGCAARCSRSIPAYAESAYRIELFGDEIEAIQHFDPLTGEILDEIDHVSVWPATHYVDQGGDDGAGGRRDQRRARTSARLASRSTASSSRRTGCSSAPRYDMEMLQGARLLLRDRELLADPRRPPAGQPAAHADRLLPRRLRRLHRRVAPDDPADRRHVRGRPLAQADAGRLRLPPAVGDRQPAAQVRRVPRPGRPDGVRLGDARAVRAGRVDADRRADRPPDRDRRPRGRGARDQATRSTT